jgi:hypothetical protein
VVACFGERPVEPVATGTGFIDKDQLLGLGVHLADELSNITLAGADGPEGEDFGAVILGDIRHGNCVFVDIQSDEECARLRHG